MTEAIEAADTAKATPTATAAGATRARRLPALPPSVAVSLFWIGIMLVVSVLAGLLVPYDYAAIDLRNRLAPPVPLPGSSLAHLLGTDELGRDILSRLIFSIRISILVALLGTVIGATIGTIAGFVAAHFRGWVDELIMIAVDFQAAIPYLVLALAVLAFFGNSLVLFIALVSIYGWEQYARLARGLTMASQEQGYAVALRVLGASTPRIYVHHILPNIMSALIVNMTLNFPQTVLLETSLSFLGLGIQPPLTSLGNMVGFGRDHLISAWWIAAVPAFVIFATTLAFSIVGDWLRDYFDPTLAKT